MLVVPAGVPDDFVRSLLAKDYSDLESMMIREIRLVGQEDNRRVYAYSMDPRYYDWVRWAIPGRVIDRMLVLRNTTTWHDSVVDFVIESVDARIIFRVSGRIVIIDRHTIHIVVDTPTISYIGIRIPGFIQRLVVGNEAVNRILDTAEAEVRASIRGHR